MPGRARVLWRLPIVLASAAGAATAAWSLGRFLVLRVPLAVLLGAWFPVICAALLLSALGCVAALVREARREPRAAFPWGFLRAGLVAAVLGWIAFLLLVHPLEWPWVEAGLGLGAGLLALAALLETPFSRLPRPLRRALDVTAFSLAASVVLLELGLRAMAVLHPSQILAHYGDMPADVVRRMRRAPGQFHLGFPCNSGGHYDDEFVKRKPGEHLVVTIGDSFSLGIVPHDYHFTTVCERILGIPVDNMGIASTGPPEYLTMLVDEALPLDPDLVVIDVFVGNDLVLGRRSSNRWLERARPWLDRDSVLVWLVPARLAKISEERRRSGREGPLAEAPGADSSRSRMEDPATTLWNLPWLADPMLERATFSEDGYRQLEIGRVRQNCTAGPAVLADCLGALRTMKTCAGSTPIAVMLIPDEFQVEDAVWEDARSDPRCADLDRDHPQKFLLPWLEEHGFPVLDLLPVLRSVPPLADGRRHLYHLRDTHFNARGNEVAGKALAEFLRSRLADR